MSNPIEQTGNFNRSNRYQHVQTSEIVNKFLNMGYQVTKQTQVKTRKVEKQGFQKHMLRFAKPDHFLTKLGDVRPEIVLVNSHDGSSLAELFMGLYRLVCSNGAVVGQDVDSFKFRHSGQDLGQRIEKAVEEIETKVPTIAAKVDLFKSIQLTDSRSKEFAEQAVKLILPKTAFNVQVDSSLVLRRHEDDSQDLWTVYNRVQESLIRGGVKFQTRNVNPDTGVENIRLATSREIRNITRNVDVNRQLWDLTESFSKVA